MRTIFLIFLSLLANLKVFAGAAVGYSCIGKNKVNGETVIFDIMFSDHHHRDGYTNQSINITKKGALVLDRPEIYQMFGANPDNNCQKNKDGEIYLDTDLEMTPTEEGILADYAVRIVANCGDSKDKIDLTAYCFFE